MTKENIRRTLFDEVSLTIAIIGMAIAVFSFIRDPQIDMSSKIQEVQANSDKTQTVQDLRITRLEELPGAIESLNKNLNETNQNVVRLQTTIEERIPKK